MISYWSMNQIAKQLSLSPTTVKKYYDDNRLPPPDAQIGNRIGWLPKTIEEWNRARPGHGGRPPKTAGKDRFGLTPEK